MRSPHLVLVAVLAQLSISTTTTSTDRERLGRWTVSDFRRTCPVETSACQFSFSLVVAKDTEPIFCSFSVTGSNDHPTTQLDFRGAKCNEIDEYAISLGWNEAGVIVLVIDDEFHGLQSFFGFRDKELDHGAVAKPKSRSVQRSRPADVTGGQLPRQEGPIDNGSQVEEKIQPEQENEREKREGLGYANEWKLIAVTRYSFNYDKHPAVTTIFGIEHPDHDPEVCVAMALGEAGNDPSIMSFYDTSCSGSNWTISWGYDAEAEEDVAVMTVMNPQQDRRAYFGFRYVNHGRDLGDNGPEPTYPY